MRQWLGIVWILVLLVSVRIVDAAPNAIGESPPEFPLYVTALAPDRENFAIVRIDDPFGDAEPVFLTDDELVDLSPMPSYDGQYLLFLRGTLGDSGRLDWYIGELACMPDCPPRILPTEAQSLQDIHWSPTATHFVGWGLENNAWVFDVESWSLTRVVPGRWTAYPSWSPDGSHLLVVSDARTSSDAMLTDDIQLAIPAGDSFVGGNFNSNILINVTYTNSFIEDERPRYSPDGRWIAHTTRSFSGISDTPFTDSPNALLLMDADCILETDPAAACTANRRLLSVPGHTPDWYSWSPDSRYIAYIELDSIANLGGSGNLWLVEVETGQVQQITSERSTYVIAWSPDSSGFVVSSFQDNAVRLELHLVDGSQPPRRLLDNFDGAATPYWALEF